MSEDGDPLEELYEDKDQIDRKRLMEALKDLIGIDRESGDPIFHNKYYELGNKEQFVALLLYKCAAVSLGELDEDEQGGTDEDFSPFLEVSGSAVRNYASDLPFVETDSNRGGYIVPGYSLERAIAFIEED